MNAGLREQVRRRAKDRCEYCQMPQNGTVLPHEADHIRSQKHHGPTTADNLCWACSWCNSFKGTDVAAYVPGTTEIVPLFNPRTQVWDEHFNWEGGILRAKTATASATIELLRMNQPERIDHRKLLMEIGLWS
jgi:hypothetical protein